MTANQINYFKERETQRSHLANETLSAEANEIARQNAATNAAIAAETARHNAATEQLTAAKNQQDYLVGLRNVDVQTTKNVESERSNRQSEILRHAEIEQKDRATQATTRNTIISTVGSAVSNLVGSATKLAGLLVG